MAVTGPDERQCATGETVRAAAAPFIEQLQAEEEAELTAEFERSVLGAAGAAEAGEGRDGSSEAAPPGYDHAMQCPTPSDYEKLNADEAPPTDQAASS